MLKGGFRNSRSTIIFQCVRVMEKKLVNEKEVAEYIKQACGFLFIDIFV